jgi:hypothetical protein
MRAAESRFSDADKEGGAAVVADGTALEDGCTSGWVGMGLGSGIGREARAGAKTDRKARSAAEIRVSSGLSDCMDTL